MLKYKRCAFLISVPNKAKEENMISLDSISTYRLHSLQDQWGVGILSEVIKDQQLQAEALNSQNNSSVDGLGDTLDVYA